MSAAKVLQQCLAACEHVLGGSPGTDSVVASQAADIVRGSRNLAITVSLWLEEASQPSLEDKTDGSPDDGQFALPDQHPSLATFQAVEEASPDLLKCLESMLRALRGGGRQCAGVTSGAVTSLLVACESLLCDFLRLRLTLSPLNAAAAPDSSASKQESKLQPGSGMSSWIESTLMSGGLIAATGGGGKPPSTGPPDWIEQLAKLGPATPAYTSCVVAFLMELSSPREELRGQSRPKLSTKPVSAAHQMMEFVRSCDKSLARRKPRSTEFAACRHVEGSCFAALLHHTRASGLAAALAVALQS